MPLCFAFLRAINVGGHTVTMDRLRRVFVEAGLGDAETFIASGNVAFSTRTARLDTLEARIERALAAALGYEVATFLRTADELSALAGVNPFPTSRHDKPPSVGFLKQALRPAARRRLGELVAAPEEVTMQGREIFWLAPAGQARAVFSGAAFEREFGVPVTLRSMNTVRRLAAKYL